MKKSKLGMMSTFTFIGLTCSFVASIRNIPDVAAAGWTLIFYLFIGTFLFAIPIILIATEFAGMFPDDGGMELWVTNSLGKKWGFVVSWLLWVQMFPAMVLIASSLPPLIGIISGKNGIGQNNVFTFSIIVAVYWLITLMNIKYDMAKICGKIGIWFGLYIPLAMMLVMGVLATIKVGLIPQNTLGSFSISKLVPDSSTKGSLVYFTPIMFAFIGQEMSAVYIKRLKNPTRTYLIGATVAVIFVFVLNLVNALMFANVVPIGQIQLDNTAQSIEIYARILGLPLWLSNVFSVFVLIGIMVQICAWATGPAKSIASSARRGFYPPRLGFWKLNKLELSDGVMISQAIVISVFAALFLIIPGINQVILVLANSAVIQYSIAYVIMGIAIIYLRKNNPEINRPFRIGNMQTLIFVVFLLFGSIFAFTVFTFLTSSTINNISVVLITIFMFLIPFLINKVRNKDWESQVEEMIKKEESN